MDQLARRIRTGLLLLSLASAGFIVPLQAQQRAGSIRIEVKDPSGAAVQASLRLGSQALQTDSQGVGEFRNLTLGHYRIEVSKAGFANQSLEIDVNSDTPVSRSVTLVIGAQSSRLDVVATTPLPGVDLAINQVAAPVQVATQADIVASGSLDLSDFLNRKLSGVYLNEMQGNPFQPDVNFRGYTASPLLGTPQGIAVYVDGVRQNQPFGDVVSWDLIPQNSISTMTLVPGSDPLFGLNTLGGALSILTKDGTTSPGLSGDVTYGSSGRKQLNAEAGGGKATGFNWFLAANAFHESGWRYDSPSDVRQGFARLGWRTPTTNLGLTLNYAYNTLTGNGLQDYRLLAADYKSIYSAPDTIGNRSPAFNFIASHTFTPSLTFSGNAYYRNIRTEGINGNLNTNSLDESVYQPSAADIAALKAAGYTGYPASGANAANTPFPKWRCIAQALQFSEPVEKCDAVIVYSKTAQNDFGFSGQFTWVTSPDPFHKGSGHNQFTAGSTFDRGTVTFTQNTQFGYLNPDRTITGIASWEDGSTNSNGDPVDSRVNLYGVSPTFSLFATDTLSIGKTLNITVSGRYNRNAIDNTDHLLPQAGPGSLTGKDVFNRFNPAVGLTWSPVSSVNIYASYIQANRAPTSIELGCADPLNPCNLPNALASDPPLKQVVTGTWQAGLRGKTEYHFNWNLGAFTAENRNDILFVASQQTGTGYFKNFGKTRRHGVEASVDGHLGRFTGGLDYTFLEATYETTETVDGTANNTSDIALSGFPGIGGVITIHPGNRIPLVPKQTGKAFLDIQATSKFALDFNLHAASSAYARGNENNAYKADGKYYQGPGTSPGYAVLNFRAHYDLTRRLQFAFQVDNIFNRHYYTAAQLSNTGLTAQGTFIARQYAAYGAGPQSGNYPIQSVTFVAPGAPRRAWAELRLRF